MATEPVSSIIQVHPEVTFNRNRSYRSGKKAPDGIEIRFGSGKPLDWVRDMVKEQGFKFSERQTMWYAVETPERKEFVEGFAKQLVEVDTTQYEKKHFWAKIRSRDEYDKLRFKTTFHVKGQSSKFYNNKKQLEKAERQLNDLIHSGLLYFKKFYNAPVQSIDEEPGSPPASPSNPRPRQNTDHLKIAERLKQLADKMQKQVDDKLNPAILRQNPTARRMRIGQGIVSEGRHLKKIQDLLYALSDARRSGSIINYPLLANIRQKKQVELMMGFKPEPGNQDWMQQVFNNNRNSFNKLDIHSVFDWSKAYGQVGDLLQQFVPGALHHEDDKEQQIRELEIEIKQQKIPGFFPTPEPLIQRLIELADIHIHDRILEPSAGKGDILDAVKQRFEGASLSLDAIEINSSLREILELKGYNVIAHDFLEYHSPVEKFYDKILMNPPFEKGQDIDHVKYAYNMLKPGGRIVAIMSEGPFFRQFKKDAAFRQWIEDVGADVSEAIDSAFKNAFNQTGIRVRIVTIDKPGITPNLRPELDEMELLEVQAQAELELLKMRVEQEKRKEGQQVNGLEGTRQERLRELERLAWQRQDEWEVSDFH